MSYMSERHAALSADDGSDFIRPHSVKEATLRRRLDAVRELLTSHATTGADSLRTLTAVRELLERSTTTHPKRTITVRLCACGADARPDFTSCASSYCQRRAGEGSSYSDDVGTPGRYY